jgi:hypothetical protein
MTETTETGWPAPPVREPGDRPPTGVTITLLPGQVVSLIGGVLVVVGGWLDWFRPSRELGSTLGLSAYDIPAQFLVRERAFADRGGPALGVLVFLLGVVCLIAALVRPIRVLALPAGAGALVLAAWYAWRLRDFLDGFGGFGPGFGDAIGAGTIVTGLGGVVALIGGILALTSRSP